MQRDFRMNWKVAAMHAPSKPIPAMMSINCSDPDSCPSSSLMLLLTDGDFFVRSTLYQPSRAATRASNASTLAMSSFSACTDTVVMPW